MADLCWMCHGWEVVDKRPTGETSWSDATGGENGQRFPVYSLHAAFASYQGELIPCPICQRRPGAVSQQGRVVSPEQEQVIMERLNQQ